MPSRIVKRENIEINGQEYVVSTVRLRFSLDHHVYETMIFDEEEDWNELYLDRYETLEEATKGHERAKEEFTKELLE